MAKVTHEFDLYGKHYTLETGELAKQATGECLVKCGDSTVNVTVVVSKERKDYDFFPLTVDFIEKMYAVGRIPGGYLKREARPTEKATLTARMIDRPLRPSFPDGFRNEVQVVAMPLVADQVHPVDTIAIMGASAALTVGGVPFEGPLACVRIGRDRDTKEFIVNPTYEEQDNSDLDLELAGSATYISMLEAGADEISEEDMLAAMTFGQEAIAAFCEEQKKFFDEVVETNGPLPVRDHINRAGDGDDAADARGERLRQHHGLRHGFLRYDVRRRDVHAAAGNFAAGQRTDLRGVAADDLRLVAAVKKKEDKDHEKKGNCRPAGRAQGSAGRPVGGRHLLFISKYGADFGAVGKEGIGGHNADDGISNLLGHLGNRRGHHGSHALEEAPEDTQDGHNEDDRSQNPKGRRRIRRLEPAREEVGAEPDDEAGCAAGHYGKDQGAFEDLHHVLPLSGCEPCCNKL